MSRSFKHLTPHYIWDRSMEKIYRASHPGLPWLAPQTVEFLSMYLQPTDIGLEFGAGRSTLWFSKRVDHLTSVEHNPVWVEKVHQALENANITNVSLIHAPKSAADLPGGENSEYVHSVDQFTPESLDFVLVDGIYRGQCARRVLSLIKSHGILIIDNVNHSLPSNSRAPNSRSITAGPQNADWEIVWKEIGSWRRFWAGNGVSDTAIFFKP